MYKMITMTLGDSVMSGLGIFNEAACDDELFERYLGVTVMPSVTLAESIIVVM